MISKQPLSDDAILRIELPIVAIETALNESTGTPWRMTSFVRDSPSHRTGLAVDFAPGKEVPQRDPLLNLSRWPFMALQEGGQFFAAMIAKLPPSCGLHLTIESDHIHCHLLLDYRQTRRAYDQLGGRFQVRRLLAPKGDATYMKSESDFAANIDSFKATFYPESGFFLGLTNIRKT